jgi:hypothetical protein
MPKTHTVQQGECLASIARRYGFADWRAIYQHADNEPLRKLRPNPHLLYPGDKVVVPGLKAKEASVAAGRTHEFKVKARKIFLRLDVLEGHEGEGTQARYELAVDGLREPLQGDVGADGRIDVRIPADTPQARLTLRDAQTDEILEVIELRFGALDPVDTLSGVRQRLRRLGFVCAPGSQDMDPVTEAAVRAFQRRFELEEDGIPGKQTQAKLEELVGV